MTALAFAWRSLVRQPARAALGILGVAAVGALLFDMLMLSDGLIVSMRELLDRTGFDVRVTVSGNLRRDGERMRGVSRLIASIGALPPVDGVLALRFADGDADRMGRAAAPGSATSDSVAITLQGVQGTTWPWSLLQGRDPQREPDSADNEVVVSQTLASALGATVGSEIAVRVRCGSGDEALPATRLTVIGIAEFPFELVGDATAAGTMRLLDDACGGTAADDADVILVGARDDAAATAAAVKAVEPSLSVNTNEQVLGRLQRNGFTYFRQISAVLTTVTLGFALLLITVLLTVSVNQRLGEIAALRALGFSRGRVVADVLCESVLIVGLGGVLSLPLGIALAQGLDQILKGMPGIPSQIYFFVLSPSTFAVHAALLAGTALAAALYPMQLVARLPIAATLRNEVLS